VVRSISVNPQTSEAKDKPRKRALPGDPPFLVKFIFGFVFGVIAGVVVSFIFWRFFPDYWITTTSHWPMVCFVAFCGIICGLLAGLFRRAKTRK